MAEHSNLVQIAVVFVSVFTVLTSDAVKARMPSQDSLIISVSCSRRNDSDSVLSDTICPRFVKALSTLAGRKVSVRQDDRALSSATVSVHLEWEPLSDIGIKGRIVIQQGDESKKVGPVVELIHMDAPLNGPVIDTFLQDLVRASGDDLRRSWTK